MMHFYGALILFVTVSAACGLRCYTCYGQTCADKLTCPAGLDRCATVTVNDVHAMSCLSNALCVDPVKCCSTDLCNSAILTGPSVTTGSSVPTGSSVLLLLASSAIITLFL